MESPDPETCATCSWCYASPIFANTGYCKNLKMRRRGKYAVNTLMDSCPEYEYNRRLDVPGKVSNFRLTQDEPEEAIPE